MSSPQFGWRLLAGVAALMLFTGEGNALQVAAGGTAPKPGNGQHRSTGKKSKNSQGGPLQTAIKDLQAAQKDLEAKKYSLASQLTHVADQIVTQAGKQASAPGQGGDKDRSTALDAVKKDIREAEKQIAARKTDDATAAIKSAISGLETLVGADKKK